MDDPDKTVPVETQSAEDPPKEESQDADSSRVKPIVEEIKPEDLNSPPPTIENSDSMPPAAPQPVMPPAADPPKKGSLAPLVFAIVAFLVVALAGGIYVYMTGVGKETSPSPSPTIEATASVSPSASPSAEPSASPSAKIDVSKLKVNILNGSGKIGEATKVKTLLEKEGFKIAATGNAASFDFESTLIQTKESVDETVVSLIEKALSGYSTEIGDSLSASGTYDIVITVGSK